MKFNIAEKLKKTAKSLPAILAILFIAFLILFSRNSWLNNQAPNYTIQLGAENLEPASEENKPVETVETETVSAEQEDQAQVNDESVQTEDSDTDAVAIENSETSVKKIIPRPDLVIGVVADAHTGQDYGFSKLSTFAWRMSNYEYPDIIVDLGDLIESRHKYKNISEDAAKADYKKARYLMSRYPVYNTVGNHEVLSMSKKDLKKITGRDNYYSVKVKGYNIIVLDSNYTKSGKIIDADHEDDFIYTGTIHESQKEWLEKKLDSNKMNLIFVHHPLYNLTNSDEIEDVIKDNKKRILLIANGDKHPSALKSKTFGGVKNYDIPSLNFNKQYVMIKINGSVADVISKKN